MFLLKYRNSHFPDGFDLLGSCRIPWTAICGRLWGCSVRRSGIDNPVWLLIICPTRLWIVKYVCIFPTSTLVLFLWPLTPRNETLGEWCWSWNRFHVDRNEYKQPTPMVFCSLDGLLKEKKDQFAGYQLAQFTRCQLAQFTRYRHPRSAARR